MLNYVERGEGPPVILVHGMAASLYDWEALLPALASAGFRGFAPDLMGHGESFKPSFPEAYTLEAFYNSLESWIETLGLNEQLTLISHSLGGYLCLLYNLRHPERVRAQVLIAPLYRPSQLSPVLRLARRRPTLGARALRVVPLKLIDWVLAWDPINLEGFTPQARRQIAIDYKRASPFILNLPRQIKDLTPKLSHLHTPSLVVWGTRDLTLNPASFPALVDALPSGYGHNFQDSGHQPHIGRPDQVNRLAVEFLLDEKISGTKDVCHTGFARQAI